MELANQSDEKRTYASRRRILYSQREREIAEVICHFDNAHLLFPSKNVIILEVFGEFHFNSPRGALTPPWGVISVRRSRLNKSVARAAAANR